MPCTQVSPKIAHCRTTVMLALPFRTAYIAAAQTPFKAEVLEGAFGAKGAARSRRGEPV